MDAVAKLQVLFEADSSALDSALDKADKGATGLKDKLGGMGKAAAVGGVAVAGGIAAIGGTLLGVANTFDGAFDGMRTQTGLTGEAADALNASFKNVFGNTPADAETVSAAMGTLVQRTGATGKGLEDLTTQVANLSRVTGVDATAAANAASDVFARWGVDADEQSGKMDALFVASQKSGIGFDVLAGNVADNAAALQSAGLGVTEAIGLFAGLGKAGLDASDVMPGLTKALGTMAKDGIAPAAGLSEIFEKIKVEGPDSATAMEVFGKSGLKMAEAINSGKLSLDDLRGSLGETQGAINDTAAGTDDFGQKFDTFKNKLMVAIEPAATSLMDSLGVAMDKLAPLIPPVADALGRFFGFMVENPAIAAVVAVIATLAGVFGTIMAVAAPFMPIIMGIVGALSGLLPVLGTVAAVLTGPVGAAILVVIGLFALWQAKGDEIKAAVADFVAAVGAKWEEIKAWTSAAFDAVGAYLSLKWAEFTTMIGEKLTEIWTAVTTKWEEVKTAIADALESIAENLRLKWDAFLRQIAEKLDAILGKVTEVWTSVKTAIDDAMVKVKENLDTALANLQALWDAAWQKVWSIIDGVLVKIKGIVGDVLDWIADKTGTNLDNLKALWDRAMDAIRLAVAAVVAFLKGDWGEALEYAKQAVNVAWTAIKDYFERGWENVKRILDLQGLMDKFSGIKDRLMDVGRDIIGGLESGVKAAWDAFWSWCTDTFGALAAKIRELLGGGHSPIPTFIPVGRDIVEGLFVGTKAGFESSPLEEQIDLWMRGATTTGAGRGIAIGRSIGDRIVQGLTEALAASTMASAIKTWLKLDTGFAAAIAAAVAGAFGQAGGGTGSGSAMGSRESGRGTGSRFLDFRPPNGPREIGTVTAKWNSSGRGGHVAASKSNYWKVFVQKFGVPTESSAREVAERLGIPLPEWLEQMYKDAGGGSNNAAGAGPHTGLGGLGNGSGGGGAGAYAGAMNALVPIVGQVTSALGSLVEPVKSLVGALVPVSGGSGPGGMMIPGQPFPGGGGGIVLPGNPITAVNPTIVMPVAAASVTVSTTPIIMIGHATIETLATIIERKIADRFVLGSPNSSGGIMPFGGNVARQAKAQGSGKVRP